MEPVKKTCLFIAALLCVSLGAVGAAAPDSKANSALLELKGLIIPFEQANLSSRSTGVIRMMKEEGAIIHKDETVVALEDETERSSVDQYRAILDKRRFEMEANQKLRSKGGSSEDEARTAQTNFKTAEAQLKQSEAILDKKLVKSPFEGVVVRRIRAVGEAVDQYLPVMHAVNLSKVYLETYLPANRLKDVRPGERVEIQASDLPGRTFQGTLDFIAPVIDPASGEFRIKILVPNEDGALRSGMSAVGMLAIPGPETPVVRPAAAQP
jgi:RND family efflux transporter MFP subunit